MCKYNKKEFLKTFEEERSNYTIKNKTWSKILVYISKYSNLGIIIVKSKENIL